MKARRIFVAAIAGIALIGLLNAFGFCFQRFKFLSNQEAIEFAVDSQSWRIADFPKDVKDPARVYVSAHPGCCELVREHPYGSSFLEDLLGRNVAVVRFGFELAQRYADEAPTEGRFYDAYIRLGSCGHVYAVTGMRVRSLGAAAGGRMASDDKPKTILRLPDVKKAESHSSDQAPIRTKPLRNAEELAPLVDQVLKNAELMKECRSVIGSEDYARVTVVIDKIETFARTLDPSITRVDAVSIAASLAAFINPVEDRE